MIIPNPNPLAGFCINANAGKVIDCGICCKNTKVLLHIQTYGSIFQGNIGNSFEGYNSKDLEVQHLTKAGSNFRENTTITLHYS
jgi:hypothetical protein